MELTAFAESDDEGSEQLISDEEYHSHYGEHKHADLVERQWYDNIGSNNWFIRARDRNIDNGEKSIVSIAQFSIKLTLH